MAGKKGMQRRFAGNTARNRAWKSMRIFVVFTSVEIAATAEITLPNLWKYLRILKKWGYVEDIGPVGKPTRPGYTRKYELIQDTGPEAPLPHGKGGLRDLNTGEIFGADD
jgi:hypothetical protein